MLSVLEYAFGQLLFRMTLYGQSPDYPSCSAAFLQPLRGSYGVRAAVTLSLIYHRMLLRSLDVEHVIVTTSEQLRRGGLFSL